MHAATKGIGQGPLSSIPLRRSYIKSTDCADLGTDLPSPSWHVFFNYVHLSRLTSAMLRPFTYLLFCDVQVSWRVVHFGPLKTSYFKLFTSHSLCFGSLLSLWSQTAIDFLWLAGWWRLCSQTRGSFLPLVVLSYHHSHTVLGRPWHEDEKQRWSDQVQFTMNP